MHVVETADYQGGLVACAPPLLGCTVAKIEALDSVPLSQPNAFAADTNLPGYCVLQINLPPPSHHSFPRNITHRHLNQLRQKFTSCTQKDEETPVGEWWLMFDFLVD